MPFQANILKKTCDVCDNVGYFAVFILQSGQVNDFGDSIATSPASSQRAFRMSLDLSILQRNHVRLDDLSSASTP